MPQFVSCPKCGRRARVPDSLLGRRVKCPGCTEPFTATPSAPAAAPAKVDPAKNQREALGEEDLEIIEDTDEGGDDEDDRDEDRRRRRRREDDQDDERPARARRSRDDDEVRPRKRKKRRQEEGDGPWLIAIGVAGACVVVAFFVSILANGTQGLDPAKDGPIVKYIALGIGLVAALAMTGLGIDGVRKREVMTYYWSSAYKFTGPVAVVLNMIQVAAGGFLCGWVVYGLFFTILRGR
jgi:hypothetical protein